MARLIAAGQPVPAPIRLRGLIDTGCDVTSVPPHVAQRLGLTVHSQRSTQTPAGPLSVNLYEASLSIPRVGQLQAPLLVLDQIVILELPHPPTATIDVLVGLDVVLQLLLVVDGPRGHFTLAD
jgi:hypothetical protein